MIKEQTDFEQIFKKLILFADMYNLEFHYNSGCGLSSGTGFFIDGEAVKMPDRLYYEYLCTDLTDNFYENCLFVRSIQLDDLARLVEIIKMIKPDDIKEVTNGR